MVWSLPSVLLLSLCGLSMSPQIRSAHPLLKCIILMSAWQYLKFVSTQPDYQTEHYPTRTYQTSSRRMKRLGLWEYLPVNERDGVDGQALFPSSVEAWIRRSIAGP